MTVKPSPVQLLFVQKSDRQAQKKMPLQAIR